MADSLLDLESLQNRLGYVFSRPALLQQALTHSSLSHELGNTDKNNETLEFLGDAVLSLVVAEYLLQEMPDLEEGSLSKIRARVVSASTLAECARALGLGDYMRLGKGEALGGGRQKLSILADCFEAVIAVLYLDGGLEAAKKFILAQLTPRILSAAHMQEPSDYKSALQILSQKHFGTLPCYAFLEEQGPDHDKRFLIELQLAEYRTQAWGRSKKQAEQEAAHQCWLHLQKKISSTGD